MVCYSFSVTKERTEVVIEGSDYSDLENPKWLEYEFKCTNASLGVLPGLHASFLPTITGWLVASGYILLKSNNNSPLGLANVVHCIPKLPVKPLVATSDGENVGE